MLQISVDVANIFLLHLASFYFSMSHMGCWVMILFTQNSSLGFNGDFCLKIGSMS